ncbi:hypothetical protein BJX96DRAFT_10305 [Aspergillus floccosus]
MGPAKGSSGVSKPPEPLLKDTVTLGSAAPLNVSLISDMDVHFRSTSDKNLAPNNYPQEEESSMEIAFLGVVWKILRQDAWIHPEELACAYDVTPIRNGLQRLCPLGQPPQKMGGKNARACGNPHEQGSNRSTDWCKSWDLESWNPAGSQAWRRKSALTPYTRYDSLVRRPWSVAHQHSPSSLPAMQTSEIMISGSSETTTIKIDGAVDSYWRG